MNKYIKPENADDIVEHSLNYGTKSAAKKYFIEEDEALYLTLLFKNENKPFKCDCAEGKPQFCFVSCHDYDSLSMLNYLRKKYTNH